MAENDISPMPRKIHMIGNAHLDPVWLWRWTEGFAEVKATFQSALDRLREYPGFVFTCAGACYYKWVEENCPGMFREIQEYVRQGRWAPVNGWWIQPDCNIPCGESFARQSLYAQRYYLEKFGLTCETGYNVDSFGHSGMLPQILRRSGMRHYVFMRPSDEEKPGVPHVFRWESADGSSVLTYKIPMSYIHAEPNTLEDKIEAVAALGRAQDTGMMLFYGVGNHGGGPTIALLDRLTELQRQPDGDRLVFSSPDRYMADISGDAGKYPVIRGDLQHHAIGCYSAMLAVKQLNRRAENRLLAAERFDAAAHALLGSPAHTGKLAGAWERVMFNQFHDILCGCSIKPAYDDAAESYGSALCAAGEVQNGAAQRISWAINTVGEGDWPRSKEEDWRYWGKAGRGTPCVVFNPMPFARTIPVEVSGVLQAVTGPDGTRLPVQRVRGPLTNVRDKWNTLFLAPAPAMGYRTFWLHGEAPAGTALPEPALAAADGRGMANGFVEVLFDREAGCIAGILDKTSGRQCLKGPGAAGIVIDETHSDTWGHGLTEYRDVIGRFGSATVHTLETGPLRCAVRLQSRWGDSTLTQDFLLRHDSPDIEVRVKIHWREKHKMLKLEFPIHHTTPISTAEIPYGHIERPMDGREQPIQRWLDIGGGDWGVAIINDSTHAADVLDGTARMTVLRSPAFADHYGERDDQMEFMEQGERDVRLLICPHSGGWREAGIVHKAMAFNTEPIVVNQTYHTGPLPLEMECISIAPDSVAATAFKVAEDGSGYILRCHETAGRAAEAELCLPPLGRRWHARFGANEIKTFLLPFDGEMEVVEVDLVERMT